MLVARAEYNYYPEMIEEIKPKTVLKQKKRIKALNKRMYISIALIIFFSCLFVLFRYVNITAVRLEVTRLEKEVVELQKVKQDLEGTLEGLKSTTKISEEAIYNLGMMYPEEGQTVYVSVNDNVDLTVAKYSITEKLRSMLSNFSSLF